jgi:hypothetical protein
VVKKNWKKMKGITNKSQQGTLEKFVSKMVDTQEICIKLSKRFFFGLRPIKGQKRHCISLKIKENREFFFLGLRVSHVLTKVCD